MKHTKFFALAAAAVCMLSCTACGESSSELITEDDMPYGSTITMDKSRTVAVQYDERFFDAALLDAVVNYYTAIQNNDPSLFSPLMLPCYHNYEMNVVYEGKITDADLIQNTYDAYTEYNEKAFEFAMVDVKSLTSSANTDDPEALSEMLNMIITLAQEDGDEQAADHVGAFYQMKIDRYLTDKGSGVRTETNVVLADEVLYAIQYRGQWYLIYS